MCEYDAGWGVRGCGRRWGQVERFPVGPQRHKERLGEVVIKEGGNEKDDGNMVDTYKENALKQ